MTLFNTSHSTPSTKGLLILVRVLLILTIIAISISCLLMLFFGFDNTIAYSIMWFTVMSTCLIYLLSIFVLVVLAIYLNSKKEKVWSSIRKETILLVISLFCLLILAYINNFIP